jgi:hypothetical protein
VGAGGAAGAPPDGAAGAQHEGAGAAQVGAGVQQADCAPQQFFLQPQRASAVLEQTSRPVEQRMAAVANLSMISLLVIRHGPGRAKLLTPQQPPGMDVSAPVAGSTGINRFPTYRHDAAKESSPRSSGAMR